MTLLIISLLIFLSYNIYTWLKIGVKSSISDTVNYVNPWLFRLFIFGITVPILFWAAKTSIGIMIAGSLIAWVGFAWTIRGKATPVEYDNHVIGATGGIIAAYLTFIFEKLLYKKSDIGIDWSGAFYFDVYFIATAFFFISAIIIMPIKGIKKGISNHTTWIECTAYLFWVLPIIIDKA